MKNKFLLLTFLLLGSVMPAGAQGFVVHQKDGTKTIFTSAEVDSITMIPESYSLVLGTWYLGYWKNGSEINEYHGNEVLTFAGNQLLWYGKDSGTEIYTIKFFPRSQSMTAKNTTKNETLKWTIYKYTDQMLVMRETDSEVYRYFYKTKEDADQTKIDPNHRETTNINTILRLAEGKTASTVTPMGKHFEGRHATTDDDRTWLLNPSNEPDGAATMTKWVAKTVNLYPYGTPMPADVNQHSIGDCCALAVLASFAYLYPDFIQHIITDNGNNTYTVKMYDPQGQPVDVCVSNKFLCDNNNNIGQVTGKNNAVTWATIMEKALMKWEKIYQCNGIEGIGTEHVAPPFTGNGESFAFPPNSLYTSELKLAIEYCLGQGKICVGGFNVGDLLCGSLKTVTGHAFTFMLANTDDAIFNMRNPWGNGSNGEDGQLRIPDRRLIVQTIDARIVNPGAAAPYLREDLQPYTPPRYIRKPTDLGVSERLLLRAKQNLNTTELW